MKKTITGIVLVLLLCVSCSNPSLGNVPSHVSATPVLTGDQYLSITLSPTEKPKRTEIPTTLPPADQTFLNIKSLNQGIYIAYGEVTPDKVYLSVMSWSGIYQGRVTELIGGYGSDLSPDKHFLADLPYLVDLDSGNRMYYQELTNCSAPSWSPDSKKLAVSCPTDDFHHDDIYIFSLQDRSKVPVTNCEFEAFSCGKPRWSPDGHWLAFYRGLGGSGTSKLVGLHILEPTCSSGLANCWDDEEAIYTPVDFSWSSNAEFLAAADNNQVFIFQIKDGKLNLAETYKIDGFLAQVAWLGNNNELLVLDGKGEGGYIISRQTGLVSPLDKAQNSFFKSHAGSFLFILAMP